MKRLALALSLLLFTVVVAPTASDAAKKPWFVDEDTLPFDALPGFEDSERMWGIHTNAGYRIEVPADWNGDLIMWTHGYRGENPELTLGDPEFDPGFRAWMLDQGYAWAASSYSKNSYNVSQGVKDTHALTQFFNGKVGKADDVYVAGYSMGGHIAAVLAENYGNTYSGAMPMCGVVGDYELFDYFLDVNAAAQHLALGTSQIPADDDFTTDELPQIQANLGLPFGATPAGQQFKQLVELRSGGDRPDFDTAFVFWNSVPGIFSGAPGAFLYDLGAGDGVVPATGGKWSVVDNSDTVYQVDLDPAISDFEAELNAEIARVSADPQARTHRGLRNPPPVTGDLRVPVLTMHNLGDLFVPWHNEIEYAKDVAANGKSDMLVQRAIRGVGHCDFNTAELIEGMTDLITWAETGVKPDGDVVLDPAVVADPNYGCNFTRGAHAFVGTPCP